MVPADEMIVPGVTRITLSGRMTQTHPSGTLAAPQISRLRGVTLVRTLTYEITFAGQAGAALRAQFDDCEVTMGPGTTTLRAVLPDQAALGGLVLRIIDLRLEVIQVLLVTPSPGGQPAAEQEPEPAGS
jgi:hypothetical protein